MLYPADADLIRRDPALPGLALLLDPEAFAAALRRAAPGLGVEKGRITYVRYKPGTSCLVGYCLEEGGKALNVAASAYRPDARDKLAKAARRQSLGRVALEDRSAVVWLFPDDDELKGLRRLGDALSRVELLRKLLPDRPDLWDGAVETLRYKPARRYVARLSAGGGPGAALKVYTRSGYGVARANAEAFRAGGPVRVAGLLGCSDRHHLLALEWLPGRLLSEALAAPDFPAGAVAPVGAALAGLHAQSPAGLALRTREEEAASLFPVAEWLGHVCPALAIRAWDLAGRLAVLLRDLPAVDRPLHGDFYAKQVLLGPGVGVLDFDEAGRGDPALDLGLFIAHLERDVVRGTIPPDRVEPVRAALLDGYRSVADLPDPARVDLCTAVGLLRLAPHPFRSREPQWPERTGAMLERAEAVLRAVAPHSVEAAVRPVLQGT